MIRTEKSLKQEEVARKLGMAQSNYARLEKGLTQVTVERLEQLAEVFEMSTSAILSYEVGQQVPTREDIEYYINQCKKFEKQIESLKKQLSESEEDRINYYINKEDTLKASKTKSRELNEKMKEKDKIIEDKERVIKLLEKAIDALSRPANK